MHALFSIHKDLDVDMTASELDRITSLMHDFGFTGLCIHVQDFGNRAVLGICLGDDFFPAWELYDSDNLALLVNGMSAAIVAKRPQDWEPVEPAFWKSTSR